MKKMKRTISFWLCGLLLLAVFTELSALPGRTFADDSGVSSAITDNSALSVAQIAGGKGFTVVLKKDGTVWTWGDNLRGKLGGGLENRKLPSQVNGLSNVTSIAAGEFHTLALKKDGTVWSWGQNSFGELGDGSTVDRNTPVQVSDFTDVIAISAGNYNSVALKKDGTVWTWGDNTYGQLGDASFDGALKPVQVKGNMGSIKVIASGAYHTLAIDEEGIVWAWGDNYYGELGYGYDQNKLNTPIMVTGNSWHIVQIAGGYNFSMALKDDGTVLTWGLMTPSQDTIYNTGINNTNEQEYPALIPGFEKVTKIAAGNSYAMALTTDGNVRTWGSNKSGQLGIGTAYDGKTWDQTYPQIISGANDIALIGAGYDFAFAVDQKDSLWAWGNNIYDQLGDGTAISQPSPVLIQSLAAASQPVLQPGEGAVFIHEVKPTVLAAGESTTFALKNGRLYGWGDNVFGQLGDGTNIAALSPLLSSSVKDAAAIAAGNSHTLAVKSDGTLWAWGENYYGQLGDGTDTNQMIPIQVRTLKGVVAAAAGSNHSIALLNNGRVWTFGNNTFGQLGHDAGTTDPILPQLIAPLSHIVSIAAGSNYSLALQNNGTVWAWGDNSNGQLGDGTFVAKQQPVQVSGLSGVIAISAGKSHALALKSDGTVWAWGYNAFGELGDGTILNRTKPVEITALSGITAISAGAYHSLAIKNDGSLWAWGQNLYGQLGDGTTNNNYIPERVKGLDAAAYIAAGGSQSSAMLKDGTTWTWGANYSGQIGDGTRTNRSIPAMVTGLTAAFNDVEGHWAKAAILQTAEKGYIDGYDDGSFRPDQSITRAEFLKLVATALKLPVGTNTADQPWYQPYLDAVQKAGIIQSGDLQANWQSPITRQEIAAVALRSSNDSLQKPNSAMGESFVLLNAVQTGILQGLDGGQLAPQEATTRAQSVVVLDRILSVKKGIKIPVDPLAVQNAEHTYK